MFAGIVQRVSSVFHDYIVRAEEVPCAPRTCEVAVYGVARSDIDAVTRLIKDLDRQMAMPADCVALARVIDLETTVQYYPELLDLLWNEEGVIDLTAEGCRRSRWPCTPT